LDGIRLILKSYWGHNRTKQASEIDKQAYIFRIPRVTYAQIKDVHKT